jgi:ribosomal protein S18 acetylase RimI-like enzyme
MHSYRLRPASDSDTPMLLAIYTSTRQEEVAQTGWPQGQQDAFLAMQAKAQHEHYLLHYPEAERHLIELSGETAGRLYLSDWEQEIRIVDIALLPAFRGSGLGSQVLAALQARARRAGKPLTIHVETNNPARRLYLRLGFEEQEDKGVYLLMRWQADD